MSKDRLHPYQEMKLLDKPGRKRVKIRRVNAAFVFMLFYNFINPNKLQG